MHTGAAAEPRQAESMRTGRATESSEEAALEDDNFPFEESDDLIRYPAREGDVDLRKRWHMRRRKTPMVPALAHSPMPNKQGSQEGKARVLSVYLRPWVLDVRHASRMFHHFGI